MVARRVSTVMALGLVGVFGYFFASPFVVLAQLKRAVDIKSVSQVESLVDFPSVRDSLRSQVGDHIEAHTRQDKWPEWLAQFTLAAGSAIVGDYIDKEVRPENLPTLLEADNTLGEGNRSNSGLIESVFQLWKDSSYKSFDTFVVRLTASGPVTSIVLERRNLFHWKVIRVQMDIDKWAAQPQDLSKRSSSAESIPTPAKEIIERDGYAPVSATDDIIYPGDQGNWYYRCLGYGVTPDCTTPDLIKGGKYSRISNGIIKVNSEYYCRDQFPERGLWKCSATGFVPFAP